MYLKLFKVSITQGFAHWARVEAPEPVIGVVIVGIRESVLKDSVQNIRSPSTDDASFQILMQDDQPKLKRTPLGRFRSEHHLLNSIKISGALVGGPHLGIDPE
jgi:hypothetical protein